MNWNNILISLPGIILGLTVHEYCHALAASKLGDNTARDMGRLTFNPIKHIDPIGSLFIIFAGFGWAKPVQFSPENLRHPKRDKAIIAAAGPLSNFVLAFLLISLVRLWLLLPQITSNEAVLLFFYSDSFRFVMNVIFRAATINIGLFIFNLFPIPPLDGSHIVFSGLNLSYETEIKIMKIGGPLLFIILIIQNTSGITILPIGRMISAIVGFLL
jgi:Zn-dependent protease